MTHHCKSFGCDNEITKLGTDFCNPCSYIHSILGVNNEEEIEEPETVVLDTFAVHHAFGIQDPSGCIQRASRILLMSGRMNDEAETPKAADIMEARTMLTRWLQLNEYE